MVVGACQVFQFLRKITWFFARDGALSKFRHRILQYLNQFYQIIKS